MAQASNTPGQNLRPSEIFVPHRVVHTLVFSCPDCHSPVSVTRIREESNPEEVDGEFLRIKCSHCEKLSEVSAVTAKRHYIDNWS